MNSKPIFHIFGVPDGFDILNGTPDITPYFQRYYNGSEENTKYSIHRDNKGNITYAYLKYNLSSYQSRTGSFFGMSLTFSNEYCTDPVKLYELLDFVYVNKVLGSSAEKGLLQKIEVESKIQARYLIPNFGSAKDYIQQEIEFVLLNNITKLFANSFQPISVLFKNDQSHLVAQIPFADANNEKIISLLHTYNRIAISPDWEQEREEDPTTPVTLQKIVIAPETIKLYDEYVKNYQSYLIESLANVKAANINDARQGKAEIESVLKNLQSGTSTDQRLPQLISDYKALSGQFAELIQKIADEQNRRPTTPPRKPSPSTKHPIPWWKRYLPYIFGVVALVIFVVVLSNSNKKVDNTNDSSNPVDTPNVSSSPLEADKSNANTIKESNSDYNEKNEHSNTQNTQNTPTKTNAGGTGNTGSTTATSLPNVNQKYEIGICQVFRENQIPEQSQVTIFKEGDNEFSVNRYQNSSIIYVKFCIYANGEEISEDKQKCFKTDLKVLGPDKGWYTIKLDSNNINEPFVFEGPGNTIHIKFKLNQ